MSEQDDARMWETFAAEDFWPDHEQTKQLLVRYFEGDISDSYVKSAWSELEDDIRRVGRRNLSWSYESPMKNKNVWQGALWYESVPAYRRNVATPAEYFCIIAHGQYLNDRSKPRPKAFLPAQFVGQWILRDPPPCDGSIWEFLPDGRFVIHGANGIELACRTVFHPVRWRATYGDYGTDSLIDLLFGFDPETCDGREDVMIHDAKVVGDELRARDLPTGALAPIVWDGEIRLNRLGLR